MTNEENKNTPDSKKSAANSGDSGRQNDKSTKKQAANTGSNGEKGSKEPIKSALAQAKDSAGEVYELVADKASSKIESQKKNLSSGLVAIADSIRQAGQTLRDGEEQTAISGLTAEYGQTIADKIEQVSDYFDRKDLKGIVRDVENFARRQPEIFIGVAFAAGLLAARFLKSSSRPTLPPGSNLADGNADTKMQEPNTADNQTALSAASGV